MPHSTGHKDRFSRVLDGLNWGIPEIEHDLRYTIPRDGIPTKWNMYAPTRNIILLEIIFLERLKITTLFVIGTHLAGQSGLLVLG